MQLFQYQICKFKPFLFIPSVDKRLIKACKEGTLSKVKKLIFFGAQPNTDSKILGNTSALIEACRQKSNHICSFLLQQKAQPNHTNEQGLTPLMYSCKYLDVYACRLLLSHGAFINQQCRQKFTSLHYSAMRDDQHAYELCLELIRQGADIKLQNQDGLSALMCAAQKGSTECCELLLKNSSLVDQVSYQRKTALVYAVESNQAQVCKSLLKYGANPNFQTNFHTPLMKAINRKANFEVSKILIDGQASVQMQNMQGDSALLLGIRREDINVCRYIIEQNKDLDINLRNLNGESALILAAQLGWKEGVQLILGCKNRVDVHLKDKQGLTAIGYTVLTEKPLDNQLQICKILIQHKADVNTKLDSGRTILMHAARNGFAEVCKILLQNCAMVDLATTQQETALTLAIDNHKFEACKVLVEFGANVNYRSGLDKVTPLLTAASNGQKQICQLLLDNKAQINATTNQNHTPLMLAACNNRVEVVELLLSYQADINAKDIRGNTALNLIAQTTQFNQLFNFYPYSRPLDNAAKIIICQLLVENGANLDTQNHDGDTALTLATSAGSTQILELLTSAGANLNICNCNGDSALMIAVQQENFQQCEFLIGKEADVRQVNLMGRSIFMLLILTFSSQISTNLIEKIIQSGVDVDTKDYLQENTAIMLGIQHGLSFNVLKLMMQQSKDLNMTNKKGQTALMVAIEKHNVSILKYLVQKNIDLNLQDKSGDTALTIACQRQSIQLVKILVQSGCDLNMVNKYNQSALIIAAINTDLPISKVLVKAKIDTNIRDSRGNTALHIAFGYKNVFMCRLLVPYSQDIKLLVECFQRRAIKIRSFKNIYLRQFFVDLAMSQLTQDHSILLKRYHSLFYKQKKHDAISEELNSEQSSISSIINYDQLNERNGWYRSLGGDLRYDSTTRNNNTQANSEKDNETSDEDYSSGILTDSEGQESETGGMSMGSTMLANALFSKWRCMFQFL